MLPQGRLRQPSAAFLAVAQRDFGEHTDEDGAIIFQQSRGHRLEAADCPPVGAVQRLDQGQEPGQPGDDPGAGNRVVTVMVESPPQLPAPWDVDPGPRGYVVRDANAQALSLLPRQRGRSPAGKGAQRTKRDGLPSASRGCQSCWGRRVATERSPFVKGVDRPLPRLHYR
jgi:hypothetical protein